MGAYSDASPIVAVLYEKEKEPYDIMMVSSDDRAIVFKTSLIPLKSTRSSSGVTLMSLKKGHKVVSVTSDVPEDTKGYKKTKLPATGTLLAEKDINKQQLKF